MTDKKKIEKIIKEALKEDISSGDITTKAVVKKNLKAKGIFLVKQDGIIAGLEIVEKIFKLYDKSILFKKFYKDGDKISNGTIAASVEGNASSILTVERTALNFLQRMSGIATYANQFSDKIKHTKAKIIDTRKTAPGLRIIDKLAVELSGSKNHRMGLYDMFLIKDNHIEAVGSITKAIDACKKFNLSVDTKVSKKSSKFKIEVETKNLNEVKEAVINKPDRIMLDNFKIEDMRKAVKLINGKCKIEASGMVNLETVKEIAETGVDYISVGAITHSVKALDISLKIITSNE
ncbi:MAG: carboxylating nicotinate-nucleotide diphosphorylase [Ignavibacteriaceae bacterium]